MLRMVLRRIVQLVVALLGISTVLFFALRVTGDPVAAMLGPNATAEQAASMRAVMGFDQPLWIQYLRSLQGMIRLDFGQSILGRQDAMTMVLGRMPISIELVSWATIFAVLVAMPVGVVAAVWRRSPLSQVLMSFTFVGQAMPIYWTALLLILLFASKLQVLPTSGWGSPKHVVLPAIALGSLLMAKVARMVRSAMLEVLGHDYVRTARSKGLGEFRIVLRHVLRNAMIPVVTVIGAEFAQLLGSAFITETIFAIPGLGGTMINSALARDYPMVQAAVFLVAVISVLLNMAVDVFYVWLDPRVRYG